MTLSKQLGVAFLLVLTFVFLCSFWINVNNTRDFIQTQLSSHAQDTATSLGLSITPYIGNAEDIVIIETMTNAIFDRGYYQSITLTDTNNQVIMRKENPATYENVPNWFVRMFMITAPTSTTEINNGWNIAGTLTVKSNPGFGYIQLWNNTTDTFWAVFLTFMGSLCFVYLLVKVITKPINDVVRVADKISNKQFEQITSLPKTEELKIFVNAFNRMAQKLSLMFEQLTKQSEKYRQFAYSDSLTKVGNRRAFELAFRQLLTDKEHQCEGHLIIVRLSSLIELNNSNGKLEGDDYIQSVCEECKNLAQTEFGHFSIFRISGSDFALILDNATSKQCESFITALANCFKRIEKSEYANGTAHIGATMYKHGEQYSELLKLTDSMLAIAENKEDRYYYSNNLSVSYGNLEWKAQIDKLLVEKRADFAAQPISDSNGNILYDEWFARLPSKLNTELLPMEQLVPASIRLGKAIEIDKLIIEIALERLRNVNHQTRIGLNISRISLLSLEFQAWFLSKVEDINLSSQLIIEIPERALINDVEGLTKFVSSLREKQIHITVERFGAQLAGVRHLREIKPDYLKIDGRYIRNIHQERDNQLFVESLVSIAHSLNIKVIAETVETIEESNWLKLIKVDYQQGYFIGAPTSL